VGRRSYGNIKRLFQDTVCRGVFSDLPLITTDGFRYYQAVIGRIFGQACVYGQVIKSWRKNRVTKVERKLVFGSRQQFEGALYKSEDSCSLNTAFIERLNLTIRQGSAYLGRKTPCHARNGEYLDDHLELLRSYYNFVRFHRALKFGQEKRTPAMQAGLVSKQFSFRDIFMTTAVRILFAFILIKIPARLNRFRSTRSAA